MRVVIVTESFPPDVNGVAHCALQTARHLVERGHTPDSLTEGVGARSGDGWRGWAALLAPSLSAGPVQFTDLAVSGARTRACPSVSCPPRCGSGPTWRPSSSASTTPCAAPSTSVT
ncbi:hypothetical protein ACE1N8_05565 [Streptomyces sp. DSM 116494]